jgi:hypothetical protein
MWVSHREEEKKKKRLWSQNFSISSGSNISQKKNELSWCSWVDT